MIKQLVVRQCLDVLADQLNLERASIMIVPRPHVRCIFIYTIITVTVNIIVTGIMLIPMYYQPNL